jgi:tetratricopeptide (TPR) repeat protein
MRTRHTFPFVLGFLLAAFQPFLSGAQQNDVWVVGKAFHVFSTNPAHARLREQMPRLVIEGILFNSRLRFRTSTSLQARDDEYADITADTKATDSVFQKNYKTLFASNQVQFFLEGEVVVDHEQFYLIVRATDFNKPLIPYRSDLQPLAQFQQMIDNACENLNRQIQLRLAGQDARGVAIHDFRIKLDRRSELSDQPLPSLKQFPARYIAYNLPISPAYQVLPYGNEWPNDSPVYIAVSGEVRIMKDGKTVITPALVVESDSVPLPQIIGSIQDEGPLLQGVLAGVSSALDIVMTSGTNKLKDLIKSTSGYEQSFEITLAKAQYDQALFYANQISNSSSIGADPGKLLRGKLYVAQKKYDQALPELLAYLRSDRKNQTANYYAGLSYVKKGKYDSARLFLGEVPPAFNDVQFLQGLCYFYHDSTQQALDLFQKQVALNATDYPSTYLFEAYCYSRLKQPGEAEVAYRNLIQLDRSPATLRYASIFYAGYAKAKYDSGKYDDAYRFYQESFRLSKSRSNLAGLVLSAIELGKRTDELNSLMKAGDSVINKRSFFYMDLGIKCMNRLDADRKFIPNLLEYGLFFFHKQYSLTRDDDLYNYIGRTHFRMKNYDSAGFYYLKAIDHTPDDIVQYLNYIELEILSWKPEEAIRYLAVTNKKFGSPSTPIEKEIEPLHAILYYFYLAEAKILLMQPAVQETRAVEKLITDKNNKDIAFVDHWSFRTFYAWMALDPKADALRFRLRPPLCRLISAYYNPKDYPLCSQ